MHLRSIVLFCKSWERDQALVLYSTLYDLSFIGGNYIFCYAICGLCIHTVELVLAYFKSCKDFKWTKSSSVNGLNNFFLYGGHQLNNQNKEIKKLV